MVKLPGPRPDRPNVYSFDTPYAQILADLSSRDAELYRKTGILGLLERNVQVKERPQRWAEADATLYDIVIAFEDRIFDALCDNISNREITGLPSSKTVHVLNLHTRDSPDQAEIAAQIVVEVARMLAASGDQWESMIDHIMQHVEKAQHRPLLHTVFFV
eukprot:ANDGO_08252.mRNA.1 RNA polymerase II subunit A C-terminal domain phosphatase SSU72